MAEILDDERVCPECGEPPGPSVFCASCGRNLSAVAAIPTRSEWLSSRAPAPGTDESPSPELEVSEIVPELTPSKPSPISGEATAISPPEEPKSTEDETRLAASKPPPASGEAAAISAPEEPASTEHENRLAASKPPPVSGEVSEVTESEASSIGEIQDRAFWGYRTGAWLLQIGIVSAISGAILLLAAGTGDSISFRYSGLFGAMFLALVFCATLGYTFFYPGQTFGMRVAGMQLVDENGEPTSFGQSFVRFGLCSIIFWLLPPLWVAEWLTPLGAKRRSIRDRMAKTYVVKLDSYESRFDPLAIATAVAVIAGFGLMGLGFSASDNQVEALDEEAQAAQQQARDLFLSNCSSDYDTTQSQCECRYEQLSKYSTAEEIDYINSGGEIPSYVEEICF